MKRENAEHIIFTAPFLPLLRTGEIEWPQQESTLPLSFLPHLSGQGHIGQWDHSAVTAQWLDDVAPGWELFEERRGQFIYFIYT